MLVDCKLNPTLINVLVEIWRPETHTFHLPCGECTITLEDVALQLILSVNGSVITGSTIVPSKVDLCRAILGKVPNRFDGVQISINYLEDNFNKLLEYLTEEVIEQYAREFIMRLIGGILVPDKSRNLVHVRWKHGLSHVELPEELKGDVGRECVVDSVYDSGNARIKPGIVAVWVEAMNFAAIARHEGAAQGGHAGEEQRGLSREVQGAHPGLGS
ncbi:hypothetical protein J1N35_007663 [Gossypium stocksii]|uniref:Aminotransferase-like plant mobile domain-containing protein n=1 Tax=Gossypium stocksii TaxID=47602 RepID=A0A9D4AFT1_9ROSI|nr:hypothetical protein J1N35_007663 [Gossypium stocksii]